jgi:hypothetical protein
MFCDYSIAQNSKTYQLKGFLLDADDSQPVEYASIAVYPDKDSIPISGSMTNKDGLFIVSGLKNGEYLLKASFIGYQTKSMEFSINNSNLELSTPVFLNKASFMLGEVNIEGHIRESRQSLEKTTINLKGNIATVTGNVADILKSQAAISIDAEDNIYLRGNSNILILIDGRPSSMAELNTMPASQIESIEIITNPDVSYDAEGTGGIINIVSSQKTHSAFSSAVYINYGIYNRVNGGLSLNFNKDIWNIALNYTGTHEKTEINSRLERNIHSQDIQIDQDISSLRNSSNHVTSLFVSVKPNKKNHFDINIRTMFPEIHNSQNIYGERFIANNTAESFLRRNEITFQRKMIETSLKYKRLFDNGAHELHFDVFFSRIKGSRPANYFINDNLTQESYGGGAPTNATAQIDYVKNFENYGKLETGIRFFKRWNSFKYNFFDLDSLSGEFIVNSTFSNDLTHDEYVYASYIMYSGKITKDFFYKTGLRIEYHTSTLIQKSIYDTINYENLRPFPFLMISYNTSENSNLSAGFNRRVTRPIYPQLNPFINVIDQMTFETGNKNLQPEIMDKAEINYSLTNESFNLSGNIYHSRTTDFISEISVFNEPDTLIVTFINGDRLSRSGADINFVLNLSKIFSLSPNFSLFHSSSSGNYNGINLRTNDFAYSGNIRFNLRPIKNFEVQLLLNYHSPLSLPQFDLQQIYYADIALRKNLPAKGWSFTLSLSDIFNTREWTVQNINEHYSLNNYSKSATRVLWLGISYSFNYQRPFDSSGRQKSDTDGGVIRLGQ